MKCHSFSEDPSQISQPFIVYNVPLPSKFAFSHYFKSNHSLARRPPFDCDLIMSPQNRRCFTLYLQNIILHITINSSAAAGPYTLVLTAQPLWPDCCELGDVRRLLLQESRLYTLSTQYLHTIYTLFTHYLQNIHTPSKQYLTDCCGTAAESRDSLQYNIQRLWTPATHVSCFPKFM